MLRFIKRIIRRMNQYARRIYSILIPAFVGLIGVSLYSVSWLDGKSYQGLVSISLAILASMCLVIAIYAFIYDTITTFHKRRLLKILRHLRGYLADMSHLGRDFMAENNNRKAEQLLENFKTLHTEIKGYIKHRILDELAVWEKPLDNSLAIAIKESIGKLEDIICKYENLVSE